MSDPDGVGIYLLFLFGGVAALFMVRFLIFFVLFGIATTIVAIFVQMLRFTAFLWIPVAYYGAKFWWLMTKVAAVAILLVGFLFIIGQGQRVIDGYHVAVNRGAPVVAAGFHKAKSYVVTETVAAPAKRR